MKNVTQFLNAWSFTVGTGELVVFYFSLSLPCIRSRIKKLKVLDSIIQMIFVLVIHVLIRIKYSPEVLLHQETSIGHVTPDRFSLHINDHPVQPFVEIRTVNNRIR